jgi:hypothetical protein
LRLRYIEDVSLDLDDLPTEPAALRALLIAERARHEAEIARIGSERDRLRALVIALQRHRFGRRSERLDPDQLALALEDLEQSIAAAEAQEERVTPPERSRPICRRKTNRGALPGCLPRIELEVDVADRTCPCCAGELHRIGEDVAERLFFRIIEGKHRVVMPNCTSEIANFMQARAHCLMPRQPSDCVVFALAQKQHVLGDLACRTQRTAHEVMRELPH